MEIGARIKNARSTAGLTQEDVAESLGVSRQTISNWENEKSYPDIVSVIKMSDLYSVSLDHLLKEEPEVNQTYMEFLEESTNEVRSRERLGKLVLVMTTLAIWAFAQLVFWLLMDPADAGGFSIIFLWVVLPVTIFVVSLIIAKRKYFGTAGIVAVPVFGLMYMLSEYSTFEIANTLAFNHVNTPEYSMILVGAVISAAGFGVGSLINLVKKKRSTKK